MRDADSLRKMDDPNAFNLIVPAAGVHVVLPDHYCPDNMGLIVPKTKDGRVLVWSPCSLSSLTFPLILCLSRTLCPSAALHLY